MTQLTAINLDVLQRFARLHQGGRLAHAYLFSGPAGTGKFDTALGVARLLNCEAPTADGQFCDDCPPCRKIASGNHPDVWIATAEPGESIKIATVRELIGRVPFRPFEAAQKIFIVDGVERLTADAGNALLKTLEEPTNHSLLILTSSVPERNLGTIVSRCHPVRFFALPRRRLAEQLSRDSGLPSEAAAFLAGYTEGCPVRARDLAAADFVGRKNEIVDNIALGRNNGEYLKKELGDRARTREVLDVLLTWFRDLLLIKGGGEPGRAVHADRQRDLERQAARYSFDQLQEIIRRNVHTLRLWGDNLNVKIPMQTLTESIWEN